MSESTINAIVPALIALLGTILTVYVGFWQWRKQTRIDKVKPFTDEKQLAYKGLWERLEEGHVKIRVETFDSPETKKLIQETNQFILKNAIYLEPDDHALANEYFKKLQQFGELVKESDEAKLKADWEITGAIAPETVKAANLYREIEEVRKKILDRCRAVVQPSS